MLDKGKAFSFTDSQHTDHGDWYLLFQVHE